ncbi:hypothetical protein MHBO_004039, partial [Bonamia ostreae]
MGDENIKNKYLNATDYLATKWDKKSHATKVLLYRKRKRKIDFENKIKNANFDDLNEAANHFLKFKKYLIKFLRLPRTLLEICEYLERNEIVGSKTTNSQIYRILLLLCKDNPNFKDLKLFTFFNNFSG